MKKPFFSICIPTRNRYLLLKEALESIFVQTFQDFEVVIHDNHSSDETKRYCHALAKEKKVRYFRNDKDYGFVENVILVSNKAIGKYIFLMGDDDLLVPDCLEKYVNILTNKKLNVGVMRCGTYRFMYDRKYGFMKDTPGNKNIFLHYAKENLKKILKYNATFISGWAIINEKPLVFGKGHQDTFIDTVFDKFKKYNYYFLSDPLIAARVHANLGYSFYSFTSSWFELDMLMNKYLQGKPLREGVIAVKYHFLNDMQNIKIYGGIHNLMKHVRWYFDSPTPPHYRFSLIIKTLLLMLSPNIVLLLLRKVYFHFLLLLNIGKYNYLWRK